MPRPSYYHELQAAFQADLRGRAQFDPYTRALFSTDASNHLIEPLGVVTPLDSADLQSIVETAREHAVTLIVRGGGTGLAGQTLGQAVIVDCSKHLRSVITIDRGRHQAVVEPGVVCSELNRLAAPYGLQYGPDPASANRATVGGMIANNASGAHSIRYGMTADHVVEAQAVLSDGSMVRFGDVGLEGAREKARLSSLEGRVYHRSLELRDRYRAAVEEDWPKTWRRASGYSLNYLTGFTPESPAAWYRSPDPYFPPDRFNLATVLCGSEGTLAAISEATVNLVPIPAHRVLLTIGFDSVREAAELTPALLETEPDAIELIPAELLRRARGIPAYARQLSFVAEIPPAMLVVEYSGESKAAAVHKAEDYARLGVLLEGDQDQANLWEVRKAGLGLLMSVPGDTKPITFIEDVAVPVEKLADYVSEVERILSANGTSAEWYAHASAGCLHLRPLVNLKTERGVVQMRKIADEVVELVLAMRGSLSGEHGDGYSHSEFNERLFGSRLYGAFQELKRAFDPEGLLNPGKVVVDPTSPPALDRALRYGPTYETHVPLELHFAHSKEGGLAGAVEACTGLGVCRKDDGVMCPSYQATRDERDSTRGRANAMRAALSGQLPERALTDRALYEIFDLCLECKGCKAECPTGVDMARVKAEFLAHYQAANGVPLRSRLFGEIRAVSRAVRPVARIANAAAAFPGASFLMELLLGIARERSLPQFHPRGFTASLADGALDVSEPDVILFVDTYTEMNSPELGGSALRVLEAAGLRVKIIPQQACCGRPMISKGLLDRARSCAQQNVEVLAPFAMAGIPIVGLEPSCILTLRDEYLQFFPDNPQAGAVAAQARLIEEYLDQPTASGARVADLIEFKPGGPQVSLHTHCHAKAAAGSGPTLRMLGRAGCDVQLIETGCCGMAGSFGYEAEHFDISMKIGGLHLFPAVETSSRSGRVIAAHGMSCRSQILDGTGVEAFHPITLVEQQLA